MGDEPDSVGAASQTQPSAEVLGAGEFPAYAGLLDHLQIRRVPDLVDAREGSPEAFVLVEVDGLLELRPPGELDRKGIRGAFPPDPESQAVGARGPLAKAFGPRVQTIFDVTAGLGADAYRLAAAGYTVRAFERHPALFALAISGLGAAVSGRRIPTALMMRLSIQWGDAASAIATLAAEEPLDWAAYFDPMYPLSRKAKALPKRPLQVLRELLGEEAPPVEALEAARTCCSRVVVKRPHGAPALADGVDFEVETKLLRLDVYLNPKRMERKDS